VPASAPPPNTPPADGPEQPGEPQQPPYVPIRATAWSHRRVPRWAYLVLAGLLVIAVAVALVHKPSQSEQASDMSGFLQEVTADIQSCAGGVGESLTALREVESGQDSTSTDRSDAVIIAQAGAANCSPANNEEIDDLETYQVPESLDSFQLADVVTNLINWAAPDAQAVQTDVAQVLTASTPQARSQAQAALTRALSVLDQQRTAADSKMDAAIHALAMHASPPKLPG
jgi:hypothetical protein